ncbi:MAG: GTPase ObgE [Oscillospiraceae bacterium]|jgi:GTP-binding protein|nr:GTPase ObgE [Oscillospiraceae bacterium]
MKKSERAKRAPAPAPKGEIPVPQHVKSKSPPSSLFVDKANIKAEAGSGGNGAVSFHREKYVAAGGPDGGDGGRGGNIVLKTDRNMSTLMDFRYKRKYSAENGADGAGKLCSGKSGADLMIRVPDGTVIRDRETGAVIRDMTGPEPFVLARGGGGGFGNKHFATPTRQAPRFAKAGFPGEKRDVTLELKLLADVGLVGFPNVGKSTLLSAASNARPKIADYHFTTLHPNLGLVYVDEGESFVMADIPGIIEGASDGAGLGHDFLRHIDRCRLILHVADVSGVEGRDPVADFEAINEELRRYDPGLASRPQLAVANKCDIADEEILEKFRAYAADKDIRLYEISAAARMNIKELILVAARELRKLPPITVYEPEYIPPPALPGAPEDTEITSEDGVWFLSGQWLDRVVRNTNFDDTESRAFFNRSLENGGVFTRLRELGIEQGDTVSVYELEFEWEK